jgi:hypothetical protein
VNAPIVLSVRLTSTCPHGKPSRECCGNAEWLQIIHAINRAAGEPYPIGEPTSTYAQSDNRWFEEYPEYRVILKDQHTNYVQAKTPEAAEYLHAAVLQVTGRDVDENGFTR